MIHTKLDEIYNWFTETLKYQKEISTPHHEALEVPNVMNDTSILRMTFAIHSEQPNTSQRLLICPQAAFHDDWMTFRESGNTYSIFDCCCERVGSHTGGQAHYSSRTHAKDLNFSCNDSVTTIITLKFEQKITIT